MLFECFGELNCKCVLNNGYVEGFGIFLLCVVVKFCVDIGFGIVCWFLCNDVDGVDLCGLVKECVLGFF